jgi:hypothetical protein
MRLFGNILGIIAVFLLGYMSNGGGEKALATPSHEEEMAKDRADTERVIKECEEQIRQLDLQTEYFKGWNSGYNFGWCKGYYEGLKMMREIWLEKEEQARKPLTNHPKK